MDLNEHLESAYAMPGDEERERFSLTDERMAEWAMRKLRRQTADLGWIDREAAHERARIDEWHQDRTAGLERDISYFRHLLAGFMARRLAAETDPKAPKSLRLPSGRIETTKVHPKLRVTDPVALRAWCSEHRWAQKPVPVEISPDLLRAVIEGEIEAHEEAAELLAQAWAPNVDAIKTAMVVLVSEGRSLVTIRGDGTVVPGLGIEWNPEALQVGDERRTVRVIVED